MIRNALLIGSLLFSSVFAQASSTPWQKNQHGQVRLVSPYSVAPNSGPIVLGLEFQPIPGWHVYWKDPGDAGFPPKFTWDGSTGISNAETLWPEPHRYTLPGNLIAIGYEHEVVYPIRAEVTGTPKQLHLVAHVYYLTCNESCVPYKYTFSLDLPGAVTATSDSDTAGLVDHFLSQVPVENRKGLSIDVPAGSYVPEEESNPGPSWAWMVLFGFLGGFILNLMPCVLPVLSIKLLSLLKVHGHARGIIAQNALGSAAGIVASFVLFATIIVLLRHAGHTVGWGIQFQQPVFVGILTTIVWAFAFNLWGFFEIQVPGNIGGVARRVGQSDSLLAYFLSGVFATLLATPCSAPFLGTAMGFALAQPAATVFVIFISAGLGMALPYFVLAIFPGSLRWLPKPGMWMIRLKQFFGFLLAGTGVWLVWVLYVQLAGAPTLVSSMSSATTIDAQGWQPFDKAQIDPLLQSGHSVFIDVTAAWCFTCKYNERNVLASSKVSAALHEPKMVLMRADWTRPDPAIDALLKEYHRVGIPFYVLLRPGKPAVVFSELLTESKVLDALKS